MPKVMLVEDDNNLREIYDARLAAEGYEIVSAHDGEEALALAVKERPDLIISDVMMPKISGFDMLDILRATPETKNAKVIMMTALSQAEDRERAGKLGADRYLVKSQVTLEDVIKVAHEVLNDSAPTADITAGPAPVSSVPPMTPTMTTDAPVAAPPVDPAPAAPAPEPVVPTPAPAPAPEPTVSAPLPEPAVSPTPITVNTPATAPTEPTASNDPAPSAPLETPTASAPPVPEPTVTTNPPEPIAPELTQTKTEEIDGVEKQIQDFIANNPTLTNTSNDTTPASPPAAPTPEPVAPNNAPTDATPNTDTIQDQLSNPSPAPSGSASNPEPPSHKKLVLTPTDTALAPQVDLNALLEKENQKESTATPPATNTIITPASEPDAQPPASVTPNDISL